MSSLRNSGIARQLGRFSLVGALNTFAGYSVIFAVQYATGRPFVANAAGYGVGLILSFTLSRKFVFVSKGRGSGEFARFIVGFVIAYSANLLALATILNLKPGWPFAAQATGSVFYLLTMFLLSKFWVFRSALLDDRSSAEI